MPRRGRAAARRARGGPRSRWPCSRSQGQPRSSRGVVEPSEPLERGGLDREGEPRRAVGGEMADGPSAGALRGRRGQHDEAVSVDRKEGHLGRHGLQPTVVLASRQRFAGGPGDRLSGRGRRVAAQRLDEGDLVVGDVPPDIAAQRAHEASAHSVRSVSLVAQGKERSRAAAFGASPPTETPYGYGTMTVTYVGPQAATDRRGRLGRSRCCRSLATVGCRLLWGRSARGPSAGTHRSGRRRVQRLLQRVHPRAAALCRSAPRCRSAASARRHRASTQWLDGRHVRRLARSLARARAVRCLCGCPA